MSECAGMTEQQRCILAAAMERVLPSDDGPGAREANTIGYADWITRQSCFQHQWDCLELGLELVNSLATTTCGRGFAECGPGERDAVLRKVQETPHPTVQRFFAMLIRMTLAGFLCAPVYGGNRGGTGWKHVGFSPHPWTSGGEACAARAT